MKNIKPYVFNGIECYDLNSLAEEYIKDFFGGMEDIFTNSKAFLAFVKDCRGDKEFTLEIANYLYSSKYKNNALTFIIFAFTGYGRVIINGEEMNFRGFVDNFIVNKKEGNALYAFLEDGGISKTFAILENDEKLKRDAIAIEQNFNSEFTRSFIESYFDYSSLDIYINKFENIIVGNEECFRRATKLTRNIDFQLAIAHKIGFKEAFKLHNEINPLFESVKILKSTNEFDDEGLFKLIDDTFYWWLIDNVEKYQPKSKKANKLYKDILETKKKCNKYRKLIESKQIYDLSVEAMADLSRTIYLYYLDFVTLYRQDKIVLRKKFNSYSNVFDKPYCDTFICQSFMENRIVKLHKNEAEDENNEKYNALTGEKIDDELLNDNQNNKDKDNDDSALVSEPKELDLSKLKRKTKGNIRFASFSSFVLVLIIALVVVCAVLEKLGVVTRFGFLKIFENKNVLGLGVLSVLVLIVLIGLLGFRNSKVMKSISNLEFINNSNNEVKLNPTQQLEANKLLNNKDEDSKIARRSNLGFTAFISLFMAVLVGFASLFLFSVLASYGAINANPSEKLLSNTPLLGMLACGGCGFILGIIKKYKGFFWLALTCIAAVAAMLGILLYV